MVVEEIGDVLVVVVGCEDNKHKVSTKNSIVGGSCHKYDFWKALTVFGLIVYK